MGGSIKAYLKETCTDNEGYGVQRRIWIRDSKRVCSLKDTLSLLLAATPELIEKIMIEIPEIAHRNAHLLSQLRFLPLSALIFTKDRTDYFFLSR